jgi:hypothetical protein
MLRQEFDARRKIILSQSHLFSYGVVSWRGPTIRLWLRCFFNDSRVVLVPKRARVLRSNWQLLSELWQTLYLLRVQTCVFLPIEMPKPGKAAVRPAPQFLHYI